MVRNGFIASVSAALSAPALNHFRNSYQEAIGSTFAKAVHLIGRSIAEDKNNALIATTGLPRIYHHGKKVKHGVVLFHGFTSCPEQFDELAQRLFARGCNVYIPRLPLHGYRDRLTSALAALSAEQIAAATADYYERSCPLGDRLTAVGLSLGGSMALTLAQKTRIDNAIAIAPFLMPIGVPRVIGLPIMKTVAWLPSQYVWWDPRIRENCRPLYAYPGFPTHALAEIVLFAESTVSASLTTAPLGRSCTIVTNADESAVNNSESMELLHRWQSAGATYRSVLLSGLGAPRHDIIDPSTFSEARRLVYPTIEALVLGGRS